MIVNKHLISAIFAVNIDVILRIRNLISAKNAVNRILNHRRIPQLLSNFEFIATEITVICVAVINLSIHSTTNR